ncbi:hypothetical protein ABW19_dt0208744 [Dactylella cylindrospora]|nr:hypothetical protein ABW19_dt0208744 [Dactylella cylindrospora]
MLKDKEFVDANIIVGPEDDQKGFALHRIILASQSTYFRESFNSKKRLQEGNLLEIKLPTVSTRTFQHVINWIYEGIAPKYELGFPFLREIFEAATTLGVDTLQKAIIDTLHGANFCAKHVCQKQGCDRCTIYSPICQKRLRFSLAGATELFLLIDTIYRTVTERQRHIFELNDLCWQFMEALHTHIIFKLLIEFAASMNAALKKDIEGHLETTALIKLF